MPEKLDGAILDSFERFGHWFQRMFGPDCFWLARLCIALFGLCWINSAWLSPVLGIQRKLFIVTMCFFICFLFAVNCKMAERIAGNAQKNGTMNPLRTIYFTHRVVALVVSSVVLYGAVRNLFVVVQTCVGETCLFSIFSDAMYVLATTFFVMIYYFMACTPLPPAKAVAREWLESLRPAPLPQPQSAPSS